MLYILKHIHIVRIIRRSRLPPNVICDDDQTKRWINLLCFQFSLRNVLRNINNNRDKYSMLGQTQDMHIYIERECCQCDRDELIDMISTLSTYIVITYTSIDQSPIFPKNLLPNLKLYLNLTHTHTLIEHTDDERHPTTTNNNYDSYNHNKNHLKPPNQ